MALIHDGHVSHCPAAKALLGVHISSGRTSNAHLALIHDGHVSHCPAAKALLGVHISSGRTSNAHLALIHDGHVNVRFKVTGISTLSRRLGALRQFL